VFVLSIASYFYLRGRVTPWPPGVQPPGMVWGTINTLLLLVSCWPNQWVKNAAERFDLRAVRWGMAVCIAFAAAFLFIRTFEFASLAVRWDENAYGSAVWTLLGLHTAHLVTDFLDTIVLALVMWWGPGSQRRYMDVSENAVYWYFVVLTWIPIYATIYIVPRVL
jgi:heme/copper-type cytochrome/quinol oxidase subunit 3